MTGRAVEFSPNRYARMCGALYLYIIVAGTFAEVFVRSRFITRDPATTATNILANEWLFRIALSGELLHLACDVAVAVVLYALFKPVDRYIALLAAFMRLVALVILAMTSLLQFASLRLLGGVGYLGAFDPAQRQSLALLAMRLHGDGYAVCLAFFGFACLSLGYLIVRSTFMPRTIGVLMGVAGVCYVVRSFTQFVAPTIATAMDPAVFLPPFVAELTLALWLLVKGVNETRWYAVINASGALDSRVA
jgi:hypothetical protein